MSLGCILHFPSALFGGDLNVQQVLAVTSLNGVHVRPTERTAAEQHVSDERLNRRLADQSYEEHLLDDLRRHGP